MRMKIGSALMVALSLAALSLADVACPNSGQPINCTASFPTDAGPTAICDITFTCDSGNFGISCDLDGANFRCQCGTDTTTSEGQFFNVNPFKCDAEGAVVAVNNACGFGLQLSQ
jgi:hypothetical protein